MFDIGFWEFALIGIITLVVVGPEKMPAIARNVGKYVGKAKRFIAKIQEDIDKEIDTTEIKEHLKTIDKDSGILEVLDDTKKKLNNIKQEASKTNSHD